MKGLSPNVLLYKKRTAAARTKSHLPADQKGDNI